ncbi:unnamed protein product, partial [Ilex paraguariensis]
MALLVKRRKVYEPSADYNSFEFATLFSHSDEAGPVVPASLASTARVLDEWCPRRALALALKSRTKMSSSSKRGVRLLIG